ncbi:hypothetical protein MVEN_01665500 [Mycena venus]|uniref:Uncharacterized protein n=1 Tax=Mycena venus TaxID=2733690 RepID=A0A8H7CQZ3_9AGAR|nr:hypothetical protein MVEN_01665500 [Mycena venus]
MEGAAEIDKEDKEDGNSRAVNSAKQSKELLERLEAIPDAIAHLAGTNPPLSRGFSLHFGTGAVVERIIPPTVYKWFFFQISSEESVLQMANLTALQALDVFLESPSRSNASAIIDIPVLHDVLMYKFEKGPNLGGDILDIYGMLLWNAQDP